MKKTNKIVCPSDEDIENYHLLYGMFTALYNEMKQLSKNKQEITLNDFKVKKINETLEKIKVLLSDQPTNVFLNLLDNETLPRYSDAILILAQYRTALDRFGDKYCRKKSDDMINDLLRF